MKQALLIGPLTTEWHLKYLDALLKREGYVHIVAVDGGADACLEGGIVPTLFVGDKDSISHDALDYVDMMQVERIDLEIMKDDSDFGHALVWLKEQGVSSFDAVGFVGGRFDHQLAILGDVEETRLEGHFIDEKYDLWIATQRGRLPYKVILSKLKFANFSVFALTEPAVVSIMGAVWPLERFELKPLTSLGLSNEFAHDAFDASILIHEGTAVVIANHVLT